MHEMHNSADQMSINFLRSNLICSCKRSLYRSPKSLGDLSYKLEAAERRCTLTTVPHANDSDQLVTSVESYSSTVQEILIIQSVTSVYLSVRV